MTSFSRACLGLRRQAASSPASVLCPSTSSHLGIVKGLRILGISNRSFVPHRVTGLAHHRPRVAYLSTSSINIQNHDVCAGVASCGRSSLAGSGNREKHSIMPSIIMNSGLCLPHKAPVRPARLRFLDNLTRRLSTSHCPRLDGQGLNVSEQGKSIKDIFEEYVFNEMPTHILQLDDHGRPLRLMSRNELQADYFQQFSEAEIKHRLDQLDLQCSEKGTPNRVTRETAVRSLVKDSMKYAIFSHRWFRTGEPTFRDIMRLPRGQRSGEGFMKLEKFCEKAFAHGCRLAWSDTCCINKRDSSELEEAIRAMFKWYRNAHICIAYLHQSSTPFDFGMDEWFKRGWTLQELLAPHTLKFYQKNWEPISNSCNDKDDVKLIDHISQITKIPSDDLQRFTPGFTRVHEKMAWASTRKTTRIEDTAYSLIGLFDLSMSVAYGEGKWAFYRLMETIFHRCHGWDILAWAGPSCPHNEAIPDVPQCYTAYDPTMAPELETDVGESHWRGDQSFEMTKRGLQVETLIIPLKTPPEDSDTLTISPTDDSFYDTIATCFENKAGDIWKRKYTPQWAIGPQWAVGVLNYQALDGRVYTHQGRMQAHRHYVCLLLQLDSSVNIRRLSWKRVLTRDVLIIETKRELEGQLETIWL